jgi:hypothetical protein
MCAAAWLVGCGLRSDPLFEGNLIDESGGGSETEQDDTGPEPGPSACQMPIDMPPQNVTIDGTLSGADHERGWCGQDAGPEQVYKLVAPFNTDVTFALRSADVPLTLRVVEDGCSDGEGRAVVCANDFLEQSRHFLAIAGHSYSVIVDSDAGASGSFSFDVIFGWPTLDQCTIHDEQILQQPGGSFVWFNDFGRGQGTADGLCGGPGRENIFPILTSYVGGMTAEISGTNGMAPVLSLRTNCAGVSELTCAAGAVNSSTSLNWYFDAPGSEYYLAVDQVGIDGGSYSMTVYFE